MLGLVGTNGIGKSTALKILAGKEKPNLGNFDVRPLHIVWARSPVSAVVCPDTGPQNA